MGVKDKKKGRNSKEKIGERGEPIGRLGRGKPPPPFSLPRLPLGSLRSTVAAEPGPRLQYHYFVPIIKLHFFNLAFSSPQ